MMAPLRSLCLLVALLSLCGLASASCGFDKYDFSSLSGKDIVGKDSGSTYSYHLRVCGKLEGPQKCINADPAASSCQLHVSMDAPYVTGKWEGQANWKHIDDGNQGLGVQYQLTGTPNCWATGSASLYYANVQFVCADAQGEMKVQVPTQGCTQNYTIPTPLACAGGGAGGDDGGLSGGWVFIIILCVVIPLYVVVGCAYKHKKLGAVGMEKCPNVEFWRDLPSLVKDGAMFTYTKIRGLCGGAAKGGDSYETM